MTEERKRDRGRASERDGNSNGKIGRQHLSISLSLSRYICLLVFNSYCNNVKAYSFPTFRMLDVCCATKLNYILQEK